MVSRIDLTTTAIHQLFQRLDTNDDETVDEGEMVANRPSEMSEESASRIYGFIDSQGLGSFNEGDLTTTFQQLSSDTLAVLIANQEETEDLPSYATSTSGADFFAQVDSDQDGVVTQDEFMNGQPGGINSSESEAFWNQIAANSGSADSSEGLSENLFVSGYDATVENYNAALTVSNDTFDQMLFEVENKIGQSSSLEELVLGLDVNQNGQVNVDEFLSLAGDTVSTDQVLALWDQVAANSGNEGSYTLTAAQFVRGFDALGLQNAEGDVLKAETANTAQVADAIAARVNGDAQTFNLLSSDATTLFAESDGDSDGIITEDDFVAALSDRMTANQAGDLWAQIVANSGSADSSQGLTESLFITGYEAIQATTAENTDNGNVADSTTVSSVLSLLERLSEVQTKPFDIWHTDSAALFRQADQDEDGVITQDDFRNALPSTVNWEQADQYWAQIESNSGSADSSRGLTENLFLSGFETAAAEYGTATSVSTQASSNTLLAQLTSFLGNISSSSYAGTNLWSSDPSLIFAQADSNENGIITLDNFLSSLSGTVEEDALIAYWNEIESNSGSADSSQGLTENLFITGFEAARENNVSQSVIASSDAVLEQFTALLDTLNSQLRNPLDFGDSTTEDIFARLDQDSDGSISVSDYLSAKIDDVSVERALAFWDSIRANSGYEDASSLTQSQFVAGYTATVEAANSLTNISTIDELAQALGQISVPTDEPVTSSGGSAPSTAFSQLDSDGDNSISQEEFLSGLNSLLSTVDSTGNTNNSSAVLQQFLSAVQTYQASLNS